MQPTWLWWTYTANISKLQESSSEFISFAHARWQDKREPAEFSLINSSSISNKRPADRRVIDLSVRRRCQVVAFADRVLPTMRVHCPLISASHFARSPNLCYLPQWFCFHRSVEISTSPTRTFSRSVGQNRLADAHRPPGADFVIDALRTHKANSSSRTKPEMY